ncbi:LamG domain-containing protein [Pontibacter indicus]|uniref:Concanavalin A-like lectin/glucanases superfamily protein n=1 Tax=Pontibacter indicus TaxID=1317125 RepID=A0A1R3XTT8_9BACT|nr:LamG domain-containing protein [Pontibacter indicus]SIT94462.1 Concanavalin A-like lectin/glucanases superfamily protein [Pontibacter indicus]
MKNKRTWWISAAVGVMLGVTCLSGISCSKPRTQSPQPDEKVWTLNSLVSIAAHQPTVWGNPRLIDVGAGEKAIAFDGIEDGLLINSNPIAGAEEFEIEVEFMPYAGYPDNIEQRFLHIQHPGNPDRRILIELRLNSRQQWYADFFMRTENAALTLIDSTRTHPVNEWATIKLHYRQGQMTGFVNGVEEVSGKITYLPISPTASTSIGTRMDKRSWFKGAIKAVRFSTK